jgi:hypothetical protein
LLNLAFYQGDCHAAAVIEMQNFEDVREFLEEFRVFAKVSRDDFL